MAADANLRRFPELLRGSVWRSCWLLLLAAAGGAIAWVSSSGSGARLKSDTVDKHDADLTHSVMIRGLFVSDDGDHLEVVQGNAVWQRRDAHTGRELDRVRLSDERQTSLQFRGAEGTWAGINSRDHLRIVHDSRLIWQGKLPEPGGSERNRSCSLCPEKNLVAVTSDQGSLWLVDFELAGKAVSRHFFPGEPLLHTMISPSGGRILLITDRQEVLLWDVAQGRVVARFHAGDHGVRFGSWSSDGCRIITFGLSSEIYVWDAHTGQGVRQLSLESRKDVSRQVVVAELSGDGTLAAVGDGDTI